VILNMATTEFDAGAAVEADIVDLRHIELFNQNRCEGEDTSAETGAIAALVKDIFGTIRSGR
jgi:hypothetical protein